ncbi:MAG TPA: bifunctional 2-methylcitrate synthase/citrate synthase [Acidimicrobiales bacterium]|nr:bifunctional 2-methylcitrate synthase/citrate synthase [Acidimicrobiales bacterium]
MSGPTEVKRGLAGVTADTSAVSVVDEESGSLLYRGYPVPELAASCSFEEVAYLIWHGELPTTSQLEELVSAERSRRQVPAVLSQALSGLPPTCHPMDILRTAVSYLGALDPSEDDPSPEAELEKSLDLWAKLPTIVAAEQRRRHGQPPIAPDPDLSFCDNFFHMCTGRVPDEDVVRSFEISMVLYAEHGFNASTFTARVITSTLSDLYSAITGAIGALKGPLHGGANEAVMGIFTEVTSPGQVDGWLSSTLASGQKVMGFGHRVYKHGDSRVPTMRAALERLARTSDEGGQVMAVYDRLERAMQESKGLYPNLDYATGPAYYLMGFDIPTFTPIFVMSRITGWTAHVIEQRANNALIRPLSAYIGQPRRALPSTAKGKLA